MTSLNRNLTYVSSSKFSGDKLTRGENLFEFIEEAYEKRIAIVHPEPVWGSEWNPSLMAEDLYDYFKISRELLNYILIDRILEIP
jgi:hypothetical protein